MIGTMLITITAAFNICGTTSAGTKTEDALTTRLRITIDNGYSFASEMNSIGKNQSFQKYTE